MRFDPAARLAARPALVFDETLPVNQRREEIAAAIRAHQVVVICGETGSGKTTQLPKICLELGRGLNGFIGHTQPRRIAARATAARISEELKSELGRHVGFKIRFSDQVTPSSYIKLMTDGILLAETQTDPLLRQYDTLLIDEAHERSLNIDFLLGYLKSVLARRRDLKLIVTSATLDAERFSRHFASDGNAAPVIEVSGRLYPIETRFRPWQEMKDMDLNDAIVDAVDEAHRTGPGDILVFLPGEREIREAAEALRKHHPPGLDVLPLFARQTAVEQGRVFAAHQGQRVVLATNVAETSLTVPGIRYVIDSGLARVKRYSHRNKVEQLQVEPISRAAASQRAGRCGRVSAGVCFKLYDEEDFNRRAPYTEPEILRSSLAGVILRMKSLHLGEVEDFPFLEAPLPRMITDGYNLLAELGALDEATKELTRVGIELARLPLDPKIGRMILAAHELDCLKEILVIAAALSVNDPRDRPQEQAATADQAHAKWKDEKSEFLSYLKLWAAADEVWKHESSNKQRQWCRVNFVSWLRLREWRDVHGQLQRLCHEHGWRENQLVANHDVIHKALLSGLLGHVGVKSADEPHYLGARGIKFFIHPGSSLVKKAGRWIVAAELMETTRLFARCVAKIEPEWLEQVGAHLLRRHVFEPHWEKSGGRVAAWERVTLHGLSIHARRPVAFGQPDSPADDIRLARELFIRHALVQAEVGEEWQRQWRFLQHNRRLVKEIENLEHKSRRPDVLVDEALIHAFYDEEIPAGITSVAAFERWRREAEKENPRRLSLEKDQLMRHEAAGVTTETFPPRLEHLGQKWLLGYRHDPGAADDGVTLSLPLAALNQAPLTRLEWLVPGLLKEKVSALLKTLPQKFRHRLQPLEAFAAEFCALEPAFDLPLAKALTHAVEDRLSLKLPLDALRPGELKAHLIMNIRLLDEHGGTLAMSRNLAELRARFRERVAALFAAAEVAGEVAGEDATVVAEAIHAEWTFGPLPELLEVRAGGRSTVGFPALADADVGVRLAVFDTEQEARAAHRQGLARLFVLQLAPQIKAIGKLPGLREAALQFIGLGTEKELVTQLVAATIERTCLLLPLPTEKSAFVIRRDEARGRLLLVAQELLRLATDILGEAALLQKKLAAAHKAFPEACADLAAQRDALLAKGFLAATPFERLRHFPRYLKAATLRLEKARSDPARDVRLMAEWRNLARPWQREWRGGQGAGEDAFLQEFRWLLEELRVALFAQELKTPSPVSLKRLQKMWENRLS
ncbi:MAG: ATP-dependent RNA helicase HrpA [Betaproteobacteria bacterium HGW-Betaproteobacteria-11]|nr:MAG: ATP-dependent RNA helicase HrpA [Betaproteobacteria bacterium HGW-Betaproteobacteria-11]